MDRHRIDFFLHQRSVRFGVDGQLLQLVERLKAVDDSPEDRVLEVEGRLRRVGDEELTLIGIHARIGHRHEASLAVLEILLKFVLELLAPNRFPALARVGGVARLHHEAFNIPDEDAAVVIIRRTERHEVLSRPRRVLAIDFDFYVADIRVERNRLKAT